VAFEAELNWRLLPVMLAAGQAGVCPYDQGTHMMLINNAGICQQCGAAILDINHTFVSQS
jgi:hypothetical protein